MADPRQTKKERKDGQVGRKEKGIKEIRKRRKEEL